MGEENRIAVYETFLEDMLKAMRERLDELNGQELDAFEKGRQLAYMEILDMIQTRYQTIWEVLD